MEIIGETQNKSYHRAYIITATHEELEKLNDVYYGDHKQYEIGSIIEVSEIFQQARFIKEHPKQIEMAQENLKRIIDNLSLLSPFTVPEEQIIIDETEGK